MRLFNWNGQNGSENTAADSLGCLVPCLAQHLNHESTRMDTNHELNPFCVRGAVAAATWRRLLAVLKLFLATGCDESNREQDLESRLLEMTVRR